VHVANIGLLNVNPITGKVYHRSDGNLTIRESLVFETQFRVLENPNNPNTIGNPTVEEYLRLEGEDDFRLSYMSQSLIVTTDA
jgi:hypothetical protein